jgi:hypothetical protein
MFGLGLVPPIVLLLAVRSAAVSIFAVWLFDLLIGLSPFADQRARRHRHLPAVHRDQRHSFAFVQRFVRETRGRSLEDIEHALRAGTFRAMR